MQKLKKAVFGVLAILLMCIPAYANEVDVDNSNLVTSLTTDDETYSENLSILNAFKLAVSNVEYDEEDLSFYNYFISSLSPTDNEITYINSLISEGYDIESLIVIYSYWKDTAENLTIIEDVYNSRSADYQSNPYWVEDTFLELSEDGNTDVEYSNLSVAEIREYLNNGYTYEELIYAEQLSRKGVLSMVDILEELNQDKTWNDILITIYGVDFCTTDSEDILSMNLSLTALNIIDKAIADSNNVLTMTLTSGDADSLYAKRLFEGYENFIINAEIMRSLEL